jgi:hypothetical protein
MSEITYGQGADKSFVSRRRSKFAGHTSLCSVMLPSDFDPLAGETNTMGRILHL